MSAHVECFTDASWSIDPRENREGDGQQSDLRNSFRFPLQLHLTVKTTTEEHRAKTIDISAGGVLFYTEASIQVDSLVELMIEMPMDVLGVERPVVLVILKCQGWVVRCSAEAAGRNVAVAIDKYQFERITCSASPPKDQLSSRTLHSGANRQARDPCPLNC